MDNQHLTIEEAFKELNEVDLIDYDDMNDPEEKPINEAQKIFAQNIFSLIQNIIDSEVLITNEEFTSRSSLHRHFESHCLAGHSERASTHTNIYYDFMLVDQYERYEQQVLNQLDTEPAINIQSLYDTEKVIKGFRELFEGNKAITFLSLCGFQNDNGPVIISFRSFANKFTQNYEDQNTLDCVVRSIAAKTITLYPIAADKVESKFNSFVQNYNNNDIAPFHINH